MIKHSVSGYKPILATQSLDGKKLKNKSQLSLTLAFSHRNKMRETPPLVCQGYGCPSSPLHIYRRTSEDQNALTLSTQPKYPPGVKPSSPDDLHPTATPAHPVASPRRDLPDAATCRHVDHRAFLVDSFAAAPASPRRHASTVLFADLPPVLRPKPGNLGLPPVLRLKPGNLSSG